MTNSHIISISAQSQILHSINLQVSRPLPEPKSRPHMSDPATFKEQMKVQAHSQPISYVAVHPSKPIVVTTSDDKSWKMWHLPKGDLIMSGEGHTDWVAGADVNPKVYPRPISRSCLYI